MTKKYNYGANQSNITRVSQRAADVTLIENSVIMNVTRDAAEQLETTRGKSKLGCACVVVGVFGRVLLGCVRVGCVGVLE